MSQLAEAALNPVTQETTCLEVEDVEEPDPLTPQRLRLAEILLNWSRDL
jgi:hypothetical protein